MVFLWDILFNIQSVLASLFPRFFNVAALNYQISFGQKVYLSKQTFCLFYRSFNLPLSEDFSFSYVNVVLESLFRPRYLFRPSSACYSVCYSVNQFCALFAFNKFLFSLLLWYGAFPQPFYMLSPLGSLKIGSKNRYSVHLENLLLVGSRSSQLPVRTGLKSFTAI